MPLAAPNPCFIISANRMLVNSNQSFAAYVRARGSGLDADTVASAKLSLDVPLSKLADLLAEKPGRSLNCAFSLKVGHLAFPGVAKVMLMRATSKDLLVGYILSP